MSERIVGKRGLLPYVRGSIELRFSDYLNKSLLPALPKGGFGHVTNTPPLGGWHFYNNDTVGCCVTAGGEHEHALFAMATGRPVPTFLNTTLQNYSDMLVAQGGQPYDSNDRSTDTGLDPASAAQYRRQIGLLDDNGVRHKVDAYATLRNVDEVEIATYIFGVAGLGLELPDSADQQFTDHNIWDDLTGQPSAGHYPPCFGVNSTGNLILSTWADIQAATKLYVARYWMVGIAYLSREYLLANGKSPELIDWAGLQEDLQAVNQA